MVSGVSQRHHHPSVCFADVVAVPVLEAGGRSAYRRPNDMVGMASLRTLTFSDFASVAGATNLSPSPW